MTNIHTEIEALKTAAVKANGALAAVAAFADDGESIADILRHDKGHDDWHASHGDPPCKSEADCQAMQAKYKAAEKAVLGDGVLKSIERLRDSLTKDWAKWNEEHRGSGGPSNPRDATTLAGRVKSTGHADAVRSASASQSALRDKINNGGRASDAKAIAGRLQSAHGHAANTSTGQLREAHLRAAESAGRVKDAINADELTHLADRAVQHSETALGRSNETMVKR
jgi:hypothetical protein